MSAPDNIGGDKSVATKITHVKPTPVEGLKVAPTTGQGNTNVSQAQQPQQQTPATTFRAIASGGPSTQVRVVMPPGTIMPQSMLKQIEGAGRTQITAIPSRSVSNTSITVTRSVTQATYIPRAGVTSTSMQGQRLVAPIRTQAPVSGLSGNFVRGTTVTRNTSSPATTVISSAATTWMANNGSQVQLIRAINHQPRQRLITQNISASGVSGSTGPTNVVTVNSQSTPGNQQPNNQSAIQTGPNQQNPQTFVATLATVLPRQQTATLVYTNVSGTQSQPYNAGVNAAQRFAVAPLANNQRQIRPIPMNKSFSTAKLGVGMNTTSISIRAPNLPLLNPTINPNAAGGTGTSGATGGVGGTVTQGNTAIQSRPTSGGSNIPATRIIQLQQPGGAAQQIIGSTGRIANNLMLQPIIVNTAGGSKIGLRPPATMTAKVQPSLTITQLGISKIPPGAQQQQTSNSATIQCTSLSTSSTTNPSAGSSPSVNVSSSMTQQSQSQQPTVTVNSQTSMTQIVNVNQNISSAATGQLITSQNTPAAVVPLAIASRGSNVLTGTITPIKSGNLTVGKMMSHQSTAVSQHQSQHTSQGSSVSEVITSTPQHHPAQPANVYIHHSRPHSGGSAAAVTAGSAGASATVIPTTGPNFLPPGSTLYYESVPASSVASTGVLSLTTTTATTSTISNTQISNPSNLSAMVTSLQFNTPSSATFTVVPSSGRAIGQLQIPGSTAPAQVQAVPVRFSAQIPADQTVTSSAPQTGQAVPQSHHQIIIPSQAAATVVAQQSHSQPQSVQGAMVVPLPTSIKVTSGHSAVSAITTSAFLRKRDSNGSPIRAAKNLGPTLLSMSSSSSSTSISSHQMIGPPSIHADNKKESRAVSPASTDGSTTVSANSSPGVDQQINEELTPVNRIPNESHFNPINDMYANHVNAMITASRDSMGSQSNQTQHNGAIECPVRKKPRRSTNDSQQSVQSYASSLPPVNPPTSNVLPVSNINGTSNTNLGPSSNGDATHTNEPPRVNNTNQLNVISNKENTKPPTEFVIRKPRACTLLNTYKLNWKAANNHFQRHSDVKPREERRPSVVDLANQTNIIGKINGWKVHHLQSQMEDLCESEDKGYNKLLDMLTEMESLNKNPEIERITDLIKGNMQRSRIIVEGVHEAQNQIMKVFDHKSHVSDIIHRCASKRNFKKREKT